MKKLILIATLISVTACTSTPDTKSRVQTLDQAVVTLSTHAEKAAMNRGFCEGRGFDYYSESRTSYTFRCQYHVDSNGNYLGGGYFHLVK